MLMFKYDFSVFADKLIKALNHYQSTLSQSYIKQFVLDFWGLSSQEERINKLTIIHYIATNVKNLKGEEDLLEIEKIYEALNLLKYSISILEEIKATKLLNIIFEAILDLVDEKTKQGYQIDEKNLLHNMIPYYYQVQYDMRHILEDYDIQHILEASNHRHRPDNVITFWKNSHKNIVKTLWNDLQSSKTTILNAMKDDKKHSIIFCVTRSYLPQQYDQLLQESCLNFSDEEIADIKTKIGKYFLAIYTTLESIDRYLSRSMRITYPSSPLNETMRMHISHYKDLVMAYDAKPPKSAPLSSRRNKACR